MEGQQNVQLPLGITECNHSYFSGNSFSASHSVQQLQNSTIANFVQPLASTQEADGAAASGFVSSPPLPCSTISSQVLVRPTRNVTGDVMPLAEAITQLSFLEFLQRCGVPIAPPQPCQPPVPISLLDADVQATPPCDVFQDVSTQTSDQQVSQLHFDVAVQTSSHSIHISSLDAGVQTTPQCSVSARFHTDGFSLSFLVSVDIFVQTPVRSAVFRLPYAVRCHMMLPHNYRSRNSLLAAFSRTILWTAKTLFANPRHQYKMISVLSHHL